MVARRADVVGVPGLFDGALPDQVATLPAGRRPQPMTRAEIARAAGVEDQAVSNWAGRHRDFPSPISPAQPGGQARYPVAAVTAWLDDREIHKNSLRPGERRGRTYGHRFREAVGLPAIPARAEGMDRTLMDRLEERLWRPLAKLGKDCEDFDAYQAFVMLLVCLRRVDPARWATISKAPRETVYQAITEAWLAQPHPLGWSTDVLQRTPPTDRWRHRLKQVVDVLTRQVGAGVAGLSEKRRTELVSAAEAFDYLLDRFARSRHRSRDEFLIPAELAQLMVRIADPGSTDRVHNPCCCSGELLVAVVAHVRSLSGAEPEPRVSGRATAGRTWRLATMNVAVHGGHVDLGAGPPESPDEIDVGPGPYDVIVMNPPFNKSGWRLPPSGQPRRWRYGEPPEHNANFAWLQLAVEALDEGGRAVVVMPNTAAAPQNPREQEIRNAMVRGGAVRCVVDLPNHLFRETASAATLWILGRPGEGTPPGGVLLVDARGAARRDGPTHRTLTDAGSEDILEVYRRWQSDATGFPLRRNNVTAATATIEQLQRNNYDLRPTAYLPHPTARATGDFSATNVQTLRDELDRLNVAATRADLTLDQHLDRLRPWIR